MTEAVAFVPGHVTGFFSAHTDDDPGGRPQGAEHTVDGLDVAVLAVVLDAVAGFQPDRHAVGQRDAGAARARLRRVVVGVGAEKARHVAWNERYRLAHAPDSGGRRVKRCLMVTSSIQMRIEEFRKPSALSTSARGPPARSHGSR